MKKAIGVLAVIVWVNSGYSQKTPPFTTTDYVRALKHATDVMVNDATSPVAAARAGVAKARAGDRDELPGVAC